MNLFESLQQLSESENIIKEADCCKGIFHFVNSDGNSLSMDEPELDEYKKFDGAEVKIIGNHVMNDETGEGYVDIEFPNGETLDYVSSSHIKYNIEESAVLKEAHWGRPLTVSEYNKLKIALNKHNSMKGNFILHPGEVKKPKDSYKLEIAIYGAFKNQEHSYDSRYVYGRDNNVKNDEATRDGVGVQLYFVYINLFDESIKTSSVDRYYINRYVARYQKYLTDNEIIKDGEMDVESLTDSIISTAENSKKDLEDALRSKNFIYNLIGKRKVQPPDSTKYNLNLENESLLKEDFDSSIPSWLARAIKMHNMSYAPGHNDLKYNVPLDSMKWVIDDFPTTGKLNNIGNDEIIALLIDKSGDKHNGDYIVYVPTIGIGGQETIQINGRYRNISNMSLKALAPYVAAYAHTVDLSSSLDDLKMKRNDRMINRQGTIDRASDDEIRYERGVYDKSGYLVDPTKYKKLLAQLHANDYSNRLEDLYIVLSDVKNKIKEFISSDDFLSDAKDNKPLYSTSKSDYFKDINSYYKDAITNYKYALGELEAIKSAGTAKNAWDNTPAYDSFNNYVKQSEKYTVDVLNLLDRLTK